MSDPNRPEGFDPTRAGSTEPTTAAYPPYPDPPYPDPAYAGQLPTYGIGGPPPGIGDPAAPPPQRYWTSGPPPPGGPADGDQPGPPKPQSPRWLFLVAGAAVLLVVGLVIALVIANGSAKKSSTVSRLPTMSGTATPPPIPTTAVPAPLPPAPEPTSTGPSTAPPTESTNPGVAQTVVYTVTGEGRAISIAYIDTGGVLQTEFNVVLPWRKQVSLAPPASRSASVTVVNIGEQVTCAVTVDGSQVRQRTGTILTVCAGVG